MTQALLLVPHILAGAVGLAAGAVAMTAHKARGRHTTAGLVYQGATLVLTVTAIGLAVLEWSDLWFLAVIATATEAAAAAGWLLARRRPAGWRANHLRTMAGSYISFVTAFLVVNWGSPIAWALPTLVGAPLIARAARRQGAGARAPMGT